MGKQGRERRRTLMTLSLEAIAGLAMKGESRTVIAAELGMQLEVADRALASLRGDYVESGRGTAV